MSALGLGPAVLFAVFLGDWAFSGLIYVFALLALLEWVRLVEPGRPVLPCVLAGIAVAVVLAVGLAWGIGIGLFAALLAAPVLLALARATGAAHPWLVGFTVPYIAIPCLTLIWVREQSGTGFELLVYLLLVIWATDIGAYAAGRSIGGPKLAPRISPKKTWAGLIGGSATAALFGLGTAFAFGAASPWLAGGLGAVLAVVGQGGDLFESAVKRRFDVKDSGNLIPGHGGLLDRVDGLIAAAPVFALFHATWGTSASWW